MLSGRLGAVDVGSMLVVPFGRQRMLGVVVGLVEESDLPPERLVEPLTLLDPEGPAGLVKPRLGGAGGDRPPPAPAAGPGGPPGPRRPRKPRGAARPAARGQVGPLCRGAG